MNGPEKDSGFFCLNKDRVRELNVKLFKVYHLCEYFVGPEKGLEYMISQLLI